MKRTTLGLAMLLALSTAAAAHAETKFYAGFSIGTRNAPPPPQVQFVQPPNMVAVERSKVTVLVDDPGYDMFQDGRMYYVCSNGFWYRGRSYRGPFKVVDVRKVPREVFAVPVERWHHHPVVREEEMHRRDRGGDHGGH